jgi:hypothetical protein
MGASGAGLNRIGQRGGVPFFVSNAGTAQAVSASGTTDSGIQMLEGIGYTKWAFQLLGTFTGFSVAVYGTIDPVIYTSLYSNPNDNLDIYRGSTSLVPSTSWFLLPAPSEQGGTGAVNNPLTVRSSPARPPPAASNL